MSSARRHHTFRSAPIFASDDELVASRPDAGRGIGIPAPSREVRDRRGRLWTIREKRLTRPWTAEHLASTTLARAARGWLVFENGLWQVVVTPPPLRWLDWDDLALVRLLERHARRRPSNRRPPRRSGT